MLALKTFQSYKINCITVCVDYLDFLSLTLEYNRDLFNKYVIITSKKYYNISNIQDICSIYNCDVFVTDSFYDNGAYFNKWKALEEALDSFNRFANSWMCILDSDIVFPKVAYKTLLDLRIGDLYSPLRYMMTSIPEPIEIPDESKWDNLFSIHRNIAEFAGYCQIFHTSDYHLGKPPWHEINWKHAGGADSFFQLKWDTSNKIRLPFKVLHLGECGKNWCGRVTEYIDKSLEPVDKETAINRYNFLQEMIRSRKDKRGQDRFIDEKIK